LDYVCWFGPIGIIGIIGASLMVSVVIRICITTRRTRATIRSGGNLLSLQARPIIFVLSFFLVFFWFFVWRVQFSLHSKEWSAAEIKWIGCLANVLVDPTTCGPAPSKHLESWIWYGIHWFLGMQGIILTATWGTQTENYQLWKDWGKTMFLQNSSQNSSLRNSTTKSSSDLKERNSSMILKNDLSVDGGPRSSEIQLEGQTPTNTETVNPHFFSSFPKEEETTVNKIDEA